MRISYDYQYLITVSEDCCLFVYKISDKEGRGKRDRDVPYAEEVLITKSDLEEKVREILCQIYKFNSDFKILVCEKLFQTVPKAFRSFFFI